MRQITVRNITIDVVKKDIKNLHLAVYPPTGRVRIAAPLKTNDEQIRLFAVSKLGWIRKHQKNFAAQRRQTIREYVSGESHYYEGRRYLLNVIYQKDKPVVKIRNKTHIDLFVQEGSDREKREKVLNEWYRQRLRGKIAPLVEKWTKIIDVELKEWQIKKMRTKWGTCNIEAGRVWFNLELAKKTNHCIEYIVVHELVHFIERHHNDRYVSLMNKFLPDWRVSRDELNETILSYVDWSN